MKNKKGFTLIEVIAVIVILGLIIVIAIPFFQGSLNTFREDFYTNIETNITTSAKNFFKDNRLFLPNRYLDSQKISLDTLLNEGYLSDEVVDYNGKKCDINDGYVIAVKTGNDKYEYEACFKCSEDDFDHTTNSYCSEAWDNSKGYTEVVFDAPPPVYIYLGTSREKLKEEVVVYPEIRRCLGVGSCKKEIVRVSARGDMGVQPIYPKNLDSVDTEKLGTYTVTYVYDLNDTNSSGTVNEKNGQVIVYNYAPNTPTFTKYNTVYDTTKEGNTVIKKQTKLVESAYDPSDDNDWAQKLNIKFDYNQSVNNKRVNVARYQWFINNRWEDYCVPNKQVNPENNSCDMTIGNVSGGFELNDNIRFRFIDVEGKVSDEKTYKIRIDYTAPDKCELQTDGVPGTGTTDAPSWFVNSKITISFKSNDDKTTTSGNTGGSVKSGINYSGITTSSRISNTKNYQELDTTGVTWYGYTEDKAGNFTVCSTSFKKDSTVPECTKSGDNKKWKNSEVVIKWGCSDITSKCETSDGSKTFNEDDTYTKTWKKAAYDIYDKAGNKTTCEEKTRNVYYDHKAPTCKVKKSNTISTTGVTLTVECTDQGDDSSGCDASTSDAGPYHKKLNGTYEYTVYDNAKNVNTCSTTVYTKTQTNKKSCSSGDTCEAAGCAKHKSCANAACGQSCGGTCNCAYMSQSTWTESFSDYSSCPGSGCKSICGGSSSAMTSGSQASCSCTNKTCENDACDCASYNSSISTCGCASWGDPEGWKDASCTKDVEATDHSTYTACRRVYY